MVVPVELKVEGASELRKRLRAVDDGTANLKDVHAEGAELVERRAVQLAPRRSGALAGSGRSSGQAGAGVVRFGRARVPWAGPIHFGWAARNIRPQPFLYDALDERRQEVLDVYESGVDELIKKQGSSEPSGGTMTTETKPTVIAIDFAELTNGEIEDVEDHARMTFGQISAIMEAGEPEKIPHRVATALVWIGLKRRNPRTKIDVVRNAGVGVYELEIVGGEPDPAGDEVEEVDGVDPLPPPPAETPSGPPNENGSSTASATAGT